MVGMAQHLALRLTQGCDSLRLTWFVEWRRYAVRSSDWKLIFDFQLNESRALFFLSADPFELRNLLEPTDNSIEVGRERTSGDAEQQGLATDPEFAATILRVQEILLDHLWKWLRHIERHTVREEWKWNPKLVNLASQCCCCCCWPRQ